MNSVLRLISLVVGLTALPLGVLAHFKRHIRLDKTLDLGGIGDVKRSRLPVRFGTVLPKPAAVHGPTTSVDSRPIAGNGDGGYGT